MARSDDLCAAIKTLLTTASSGSPPASIEQGFAPEHDRIAMTGKYVYIFSVGPQSQGNVSRALQLMEYKTGIVIVERYSDPAKGAEEEAVPVAWIQEQKLWVEQYVFNVLNPKTVRPLSMWPNRCEWVTEVAAEWLKPNKIFWSEVEVDYREFAAN